MNRAKRQTPTSRAHLPAQIHAQVASGVPVVVDLAGWRLTVRTCAAPQPAHGWYARRVPRPR